MQARCQYRVSYCILQVTKASMESTNSHGGEGANNNDESDDFVELTAAAPETNWIMMPFAREGGRGGTMQTGYELKCAVLN